MPVTTRIQLNGKAGLLMKMLNSSTFNDSLPLRLFQAANSTLETFNPTDSSGEGSFDLLPIDVFSYFLEDLLPPIA